MHFHEVGGKLEKTDEVITQETTKSIFYHSLKTGFEFALSKRSELTKEGHY